MQELFKKTEIGNAEALRSQSARPLNSSALSATPRFRHMRITELEKLIKSRLMVVCYGGEAFSF